ncbi:MAG: EamA family transporter [Nitrospinaceae bacterium]|nr:EamA family transporter [Nitrospinaceae bacterium]MBT3432318.1 EamA family transporter [Nitrospinaceae bacterium]MBT4430816.1 EamA family transporter [Nitrospinaceae bacterium]MBT5367463.1 EamA family transporter [Nitrospinaceae bacterium]MBT5947901.1 EamA family transporter [Nitrospinaceae bacterium]
MDLFPLGLIFIAAFLHAFWNFAAKGADEPRAMLQISLWASLIIFAPVFIWRFELAAIPPGAWKFILTTGTLHSFYFYALGRAYQEGELSRIYPLARGSAPVLAAMLAVLFLGERISLTGGAAILLIVAGVFTSHIGPGTAGMRGILGLFKEPGSRWALATGLVTSIYSVVDKAGVTLAPPEIYIYLMFTLTALLNLSLQLTKERVNLKTLHLGDPKTLLRAATGGFCMMGAYGLVLFAMRMSQVSYVVAAREVSVLIGAALGVFILKEGGKRQKMIGAGLVAAGLVIFALVE